MNSHRRTRLHVELLEDRLTPALTVRLTPAGLLEITGTPSRSTPAFRDVLELTMTANNTWRVREGFFAAPGALATPRVELGTYLAPAGVSMRVQHHNFNDVDFRLNGFTASGNLTLDTGFGNPTARAFYINSTVLGGRIQGNITMRSSSGIDSLAVGIQPNLVGRASATVDGNVLVIGAVSSRTLFIPAAGGYPAESYDGDAFILQDNDPLMAPGFGSTVHGNVTTINVETVGIGDAAGGQPNNALVNGSLVSVGAQSNLTMSMSIKGTVNGDVTMVGTNVFDSPTTSVILGVATPFPDSFRLRSASTIGGNLTVNALEGRNNFRIQGTGQLRGNLNYTGGNSQDVFELRDTPTVQGSVSIYAGNGDNLFNMNNVGAMIFGNLSYTGGNGSDTLGSLNTVVFPNVLTPTTFIGTVFGNVSWDMGHGLNTVVIDATAVINGATFRYNGGSGVDTLTLNNAAFYALSANLGAGADTFTYGAAATVGSDVIDGGIDADLDTYIQTAPLIVTWSQTLKNFP